MACLAGFGCARGPIKSPEQAMRPAKAMPAELSDDLGMPSLAAGLEANLRRLRELEAGTVLSFGPRKIPRDAYVRSLELLLNEAKADETGEKFRAALRAEFEPYEVYGNAKWGEVKMTSYYEPVIPGSRKPTSRFHRALYESPRDLVEVDLGSFVAARPSLGTVGVLEQRSQSSILRGRVITAPGKLPKIVAYPPRGELVAAPSTGAAGHLRDVATPIAWVDPVDAFVLEIQGSGVVRFEDGSEQPVGYASQNGRPYFAIGTALLDVIPKKKMSMQAIEAHLRSLSDADAQKIMNLNPSFVFFRKIERSGYTYFGTEVVAGRTIATDQTYFPKGALAYLEFEQPYFDPGSEGSFEASGWKKTSRFVLDQDTGGAIRGPGRLDLFWGRGPEARRHAGVVNNPGRLVYFVPKQSLLDKFAP